jgi:hypothetical protein
MDPEAKARELERLEEWVCDILPDALAGDAQAAFTVIDIIEEKFVLLGIVAAYPTSRRRYGLEGHRTP